MHSLSLRTVERHTGSRTGTSCCFYCGAGALLTPSSLPGTSVELLLWLALRVASRFSRTTLKITSFSQVDVNVDRSSCSVKSMGTLRDLE